MTTTAPAPRIYIFGWDGRSRPMYRYVDEKHLPTYAQRTVTRADLEANGITPTQ